jgi:hypothetical protein
VAEAEIKGQRDNNGLGVSLRCARKVELLDEQGVKEDVTATMAGGTQRRW